MRGSTLPVWLIILLLGVVANFILGWFNPFISSQNKRRIKSFSKRNKSIASEEVSIVSLKYHFDPFAYLVLSSIMNFKAFIVFAVDRFQSDTGIGIKMSLLICFLFAVAVLEGLVLVVSMVLENFKASLITKYYKRHYNVDVIEDDRY